MGRGRTSAIATVMGSAVFVCAALTAVAPSVGATAQVESVDRYRYLRQLSLDLLRRVPSVEELEALDGVEDVDEAMMPKHLRNQSYIEEKGQ